MSFSHDNGAEDGGGRRALLASSVAVPVGSAGPLPVLPPAALTGDEAGADDWEPAAEAAEPPKAVGSMELICGPMYSGKSTALLNEYRVHRAAGVRCALITYAGSARALPPGARRADSPPAERAQLVRTHDGDDELATIACTSLSDDARVSDALRSCECVFVDELHLFLKPATDDTDEMYAVAERYAQAYSAIDRPSEAAWDRAPLLAAHDYARRKLVMFIAGRKALHPAVAVLAEAARVHGTRVVAAGLSSDSDMRPFHAMPEFEALCDRVHRRAAPRCSEPRCAARDVAFTMRVDAQPSSYLIGGAAAYRPVCRAHHPRGGQS